MDAGCGDERLLDISDTGGVLVERPPSAKFGAFDDAHRVGDYTPHPVWYLPTATLSQNKTASIQDDNESRPAFLP